MLHGAVGEHSSVAQEHDPVGVLRRRVRIVDDEKAGELRAGDFGSKERVHVPRVTDVQEGRRLVEQERRRALGERTGDGHATLFAPRERVDPAGGEARQVGPRQRRVDRRAIVGRRDHHRALMRCSAHRHDLAHREAEGDIDALRHDRDRLRDLLSRERRDGVAPDTDRASGKRNGARQRADQRRFARAVWPEHRDELARGQRDRHVVQHDATVTHHADGAGFDERGRPPSLLVHGQAHADDSHSHGTRAPLARAHK